MVTSPKSRSWWVLWIWVCLCLALAPKMFQLCTNQLVVLVLCRSVWMNDCLSFFLISSRSSSTPFYPQSATSQEACPNSLLGQYFHFRLTFEYIKELGNASIIISTFYFFKTSYSHMIFLQVLIQLTIWKYCMQIMNQKFHPLPLIYSKERSGWIVNHIHLHYSQCIKPIIKCHL